MKKHSFAFPLTILTSCLLSVSASAQLALNDTYTVRSDTANGRLSQIFTGGAPTGSYSYASGTSIEVRPAGSNPNRRMSAAIFYFELPELDAGLSVGNANLSFSLLSTPGSGPGSGNLDLYGLGFSTSPSIATAARADFWHMGEDDTRPGLGISSVMKLQEGVVLAADYPNGVSTTHEETTPGPVNFTADANLDVFLNSLYESGAQPGDFAIFRLSYADSEFNPNGTIYGYNLHGSGADPAATDPTLSFTAIPEPSTVALFSGLGVLAAAMFLRRRSQKSLYAHVTTHE